MEPRRNPNSGRRAVRRRKSKGFLYNLINKKSAKRSHGRMDATSKFSGFTGEFGIPVERSAAHHTHKRSKSKTVLSVVGRVVMSMFLIGLITGTIVVGAFAIYVFKYVDGSIDFDLNNLTMNATTIIYATDENGQQYELQRLHRDENRVWVEYNEISGYMPNAAIAIEDQRFRTHGGVDWKRTAGAFVNMFIDIYSSRQGGSTITQQLVKNITGDDEISSMRKIQEIMRAREIEKTTSKDAILECYLNTIHLGNGCDGVETASNFYFSKSASELTLLESASLAATIKNPSKFNPLDNPENNKERREYVLSEMKRQKLITQEEYDQAMSEELVVKKNENLSSGSAVYSYFVDTLIREVISDLMTEKNITQKYAENMLYSGGLKIQSTLVPSVQNSLDEVYKDDSNFYKFSGSTQAESASVVMDYQGHIVGIVGGRGEKTESLTWNRATVSTRQPGSTFKPLSAYAPAIENDLVNWGTAIKTTAYTNPADNHTIKNNIGVGSASVQTALERSSNTIPAWIIKDMTIDYSYNYLTTRLGLTLAESDKDMSPLAVGATTGGPSLLEMTAAYATFGNLGKYWEPTTYTLITDQHDETILQQQERPSTAMSEATANIMNELLQFVIYGDNGTGKKAAFGDEYWPLFGKTGTTDKNHDRWFMGGSAYYVCGTWFGFDIGKNMNTGYTNPAVTVWKAVMSKVHENLERKDFQDTDETIYVRYCSSTGKIARTGCGSTRVGWYKAANYVDNACTSHGGDITDSLTKPDPLTKPKYTTSTTGAKTSSSSSSSQSTSTAAQTQAATSTQPVSNQTPAASSMTSSSKTASSPSP